MMKKNLVLILGAGATFSDAANKSKTSAPPLDKDFFSNCRSNYSKSTELINKYFLKNYHRNIFSPKYDSLEGVMSTIYTDLFDPILKNSASKMFVTLIKLFNKRLAKSTNSIKINHQRHLYRLLVKYFECGYDPSNITFITFNQDLQIERILDSFQFIEKWKHLELFSFPRCYGLNMAGLSVTSSRNITDYFEQPDDLPAKIKIFKLHGSLNWSSPNDTDDYSPELLFQRNRVLKITTRRKIFPDLRYNNPDNPYSLPIIIPPVNNKSAIMHNQIKLIWSKAGKKMKKANEVVFWGYSLPEMDFESKNLFQRNIIGNDNIKEFILIDPEPNVVAKYIDEFEIKNLTYYKNVTDLFENFIG